MVRSLLATALAPALSKGEVPAFQEDDFKALFEAARASLGIGGRPKDQFVVDLKELVDELSLGCYCVEFSDERPVDLILKDEQGREVLQFQLLRGMPVIWTG